MFKSCRLSFCCNMAYLSSSCASPLLPSFSAHVQLQGQSGRNSSLTESDASEGCQRSHVLRAAGRARVPRVRYILSPREHPHPSEGTTPQLFATLTPGNVRGSNTPLKLRKPTIRTWRRKQRKKHPSNLRFFGQFSTSKTLAHISPPT